MKLDSSCDAAAGDGEASGAARNKLCENDPLISTKLQFNSVLFREIELQNL